MEPNHSFPLSSVSEAKLITLKKTPQLIVLEHLTVLIASTMSYYGGATEAEAEKTKQRKRQVQARATPQSERGVEEQQSEVPVPVPVQQTEEKTPQISEKSVFSMLQMIWLG